MIEVKNLSASYGRKKESVIKDFSFSLKRGEVGILLGPNGAGKTTLFKALLGTIKSRGEVYIEGKNLRSYPSRRRSKEMSYIPQQVFFGHLSVYDSVLLGRLPDMSLFPSREDEEAVKKTLERLDLLSLARRDAETLSGGEKQRVAIARALVCSPKLVLSDEPTSNLDLKNQVLMLEEIVRLAKEGGETVLLAMHDIRSALLYGDEFLLVKDGKLLAQKKREELTLKDIEETFSLPEEDSRFSFLKDYLNLKKEGDTDAKDS